MPEPDGGNARGIQNRMTDTTANDLLDTGPAAPYVIRKPLRHRDPPQLDQRPLRGAIPDMKPAVTDLLQSRPLRRAMADLKPVGGHASQEPPPSNKMTEPSNRLTEKKSWIEIAQSRSLTPPVGPWRIDKAPKQTPDLWWFEEGASVQRPSPAAPWALEPEVFITNKIRFKPNRPCDDNPIAQFADPDYLIEIKQVAEFLRRHPDRHVELRASIGYDFEWQLHFCKENAFKIMDARAEAVAKVLEAYGIDRARIQTARGTIAVGEEHRTVEFLYFVP